MLVKVVIDRFEGDKAVLVFEHDDLTGAPWPRSFLPEGVEEGDVLSLELEIDREATDEARKIAAELLSQIIKKNK